MLKYLALTLLAAKSDTKKENVISLIRLVFIKKINIFIDNISLLLYIIL